MAEDLRRYVLGLFLRGELGSLEEGAVVAGVSRVTVRNWLVAARIDWKARRQHYLARQRTRALNQASGRQRKRLTKAQRREIAEKAKREWDARNGKA